MSHLSEKSAQVKQGEQSLTISEKSIMPYPNPDVLAGYEKVEQGFANRLMVMMEKEQDGRIERENKKEDGRIVLANRRENTTRWGLLIGALVVLPIYGISFYAFSIGHAVEGASILIGTTIANLAGIFVARKTGLFDDKKD